MYSDYDATSNTGQRVHTGATSSWCCCVLCCVADIPLIFTAQNGNMKQASTFVSCNINTMQQNATYSNNYQLFKYNTLQLYEVAPCCFSVDAALK